MGKGIPNCILKRREAEIGEPILSHRGAKRCNEKACEDCGWNPEVADMRREFSRSEGFIAAMEFNKWNAESIKQAIYKYERI